MNKLLSFLWSAAGLALLLPCSHAESPSDPKPFGLSLEWYQLEFDLAVLGVKANMPGVNNQTLNTLAHQLDTRNTLELLNLRLDYQLHPNLNLYGSIGKLKDSTKVDLSAVTPLLSTMHVDTKGMAYTVGSVLSKHNGSWIMTVNLAHTRLEMDNNEATAKINSLVPSIGKQTHYGVFNTSLVYQAVKASYSGTVTVPFLGEVPVTVDTENKGAFQIFAGWHRPIAKDLFINANVGLNGEKQLHLQLNKRF